MVIKIITGIVVVPIALLAYTTYPWWQQASLPLKILTTPLILPIAGLAFIFSFWWNDL